jgi:hypothetical protein
MPLLDFQTAFGHLVRAPNGDDALRSLNLDAAERESLDALPRGAGFRFTVAVQRSWCARRAVNAGLLALSVLRDDARRRLLDTWIASGGGTSSFFAAEADALLEFIAEQLADPSPELTLCRFEQLTLRANEQASLFAPDLTPFDPQRVIRRSRHAGMVIFHGEPAEILSTLLQRKPLPGTSLDATALLVAPGLQPLCRVATPQEGVAWRRLAVPTAAAVLVEHGCPQSVIETLLQVGAVEYA